METSWQVLSQNFTNILVAIVGFFLVRTLNRLEKQFENMDKKVDDHERRISTVEGWRGAFRR